ncbi:MAG: hypothetical protein LAN71_14130 [Acidobacteriia bacterium]|nr:hypothetical protein [Terriglobia bacterium]
MTASNAGPVRILLVGESPMGFSYLSQRLEKRGCECCVAYSNYDGARLFREHPFDLVLCCGSREGIESLVTSIIGSSASLYRSHRVEDGCWWLPAVLRGEACTGAPAFQPGEFMKVLDQVVESLRPADTAAPLAHSQFA